MPNNLWSGAHRSGTAANRPSTPADFPSETFGFYYETDTGNTYVGTAGGTGWQLIGGAQGTPAAYTATATVTIAELLTRILTSTSASAVALTLPTGTLTDAGLGAGTLSIGQSFDFCVINLGSSSGVVTMTAGTAHTIVGLATLAINTSAMFRTRKTAANTFVTYRLT